MSQQQWVHVVVLCVCLHAGVSPVAACGTAACRPVHQAAQLAVSLLQPDVATLISRGDTLVYGLHGRDVARAEALRRKLDGLRARWHALKSHMEVSWQRAVRGCHRSRAERGGGGTEGDGRLTEGDCD